MQESLQKQVVGMEKVLSEQQQTLTRKTSELSAVVSELKNMGDVKKVMSSLLSAYQEQNRLLTAAINQRGQTSTPLPIQQPTTKLPSWLVAIIIVAAVAIVIVTAVLLYVMQSFHWISL